MMVFKSMVEPRRAEASAAGTASHNGQGAKAAEDFSSDGDNGSEAELDAAATWALDVEKEARKIRVRKAAQRKIKREQQRDLGDLEPIPLADFLAIPDDIIRYRMDSLWPIGGRIILSAQFKAGKTTLSGNVTHSLADGDPFLGRFDTVPARVVLLDFEMDERTVRQWLRDQQIRNTGNASVRPLRGKASSFDILDAQIRSEWAARIRGHDVVILDCLRPILDALGLSEDKDAGRFLVALDELLNEAGVSEALVIHHMGHTGERGRGDSRILDWPDANWKLVREDPENENSPRYFSAYGRGVFRAESLLGYAPDARRLTLLTGNRKDAANERLMPPLLDLLRAKPEGLSGRQLDEAMGEAGHGRNAARNARTYAVKRLYVTTGRGEKNAIIHKINPDLPK